MSDLLLDTSAAVPLVLATHQAHRSVNASVGRRSVALAGHALHETYAVLTRLPGDARLAPSDAVAVLDDRFEPAVMLDAKSARRAVVVLAENGIAGGATYDGLIALVARSTEVPLGTRDRRAEATYRRLGVAVELLG